MEGHLVETAVNAVVLGLATKSEIIAGTHVHGTDFAPPEPADDIRDTFSTGSKFKAGSLAVWVGGLIVLPGVVYNEGAGLTDYVFTSPPPAGAVIQHAYIKGE